MPISASSTVAGLVGVSTLTGFGFLDSGPSEELPLGSGPSEASTSSGTSSSGSGSAASAGSAGVIGSCCSLSRLRSV